MFGMTRQVRVIAYSAPVDMRKSFHTLSGLILESGQDVLQGGMFLFVSKCRRRAKVLWFDGTGLLLLAKVLEQGRFAAVWSRADPEMSLSELAVFLDANQDVGRASIVQRVLVLKKQPT